MILHSMLTTFKSVLEQMNQSEMIWDLNKSTYVYFGSDGILHRLWTAKRNCHAWTQPQDRGHVILNIWMDKQKEELNPGWNTQTNNEQH